MTWGMLLALVAIGTLVVFVLVGLLLRTRSARGSRSGSEAQNTTAQWTEGETTRLLSSAEVPGLYLLRTRFLSKAENVVYLLLKAAFPRHAIVDAKEPEQVQNPRDQKLEIIKQRCLQAAQVKYICVYPPTLPRYRELRAQVLGPAAELV